ncbi:MAG: hypothetical protein OXT09_34145 [Myxococcales bacterium]|nr:hypothetical protein [Myxococcales bacterium]
MSSQRAVWSCALLAALALSIGCSSPVIAPRTANVRDAGEVAVRLSGHAHRTEVEARIAAPPDAPADEEQIVRSDRSRTGVELLGQAILLPATAEAQPAFGIADGLELNGLASMRRLGLELRGQLLDERDGAPLSLALSGAGMFGVLSGPEGPRARGGLDLSVDADAVLWLLGLYVGYGPQLYEFSQGGWVRHGGFTPAFDIAVERDEVRLSVPFGIAFPTGRRAAIVLGVAPEWTVQSEVTRARCEEAGDCRAVLDDDSVVELPITSFSQTFEFFITLSLEIDTLREPPARPGKDIWNPEAER